MRRFNAEVPQVVHLGRPRGARQLVLGARPDARRALPGEERGAAGGTGAPGVPRVPADRDPPATIRSGSTARCPYGPLVDIFALDLRSYRGPNSENRQPVLDDRVARSSARTSSPALKARLAASRATWKVIASDLPVGVVVRDGPSHFEAIANGDPGAPLGRELELADLLRFIRDREIRNVVWVTGDVHYCAAHHYHPSRARVHRVQSVLGVRGGAAATPGPSRPASLDPTFGPEVKFTGTTAATTPNRPPSAGLQFFGTLTIDARTRAMTAKLIDVAGKELYSVELPAE